MINVKDSSVIKRRHIEEEREEEEHKGEGEGEGRGEGVTEIARAEWQQQLNVLQDKLDSTSRVAAQLQEDNTGLVLKMDKKLKILKDAVSRAAQMEEQLKRKDTEIKAVLNFQKKIESRMVAFVEKEKELAQKEKKFQARAEKKRYEEDVSRGLHFDEMIEHGNNGGGYEIPTNTGTGTIRHAHDTDTPVHSKQADATTFAAEKIRLLAEIKSLHESKKSSADLNSKLRAEIKELKKDATYKIKVKEEPLENSENVTMKNISPTISSVSQKVTPAKGAIGYFDNKLFQLMLVFFALTVAYFASLK
jgi:hypothetical protein